MDVAVVACLASPLVDRIVSRLGKRRDGGVIEISPAASNRHLVSEPLPRLKIFPEFFYFVHNNRPFLSIQTIMSVGKFRATAGGWHPKWSFK